MNRDEGEPVKSESATGAISRRHVLQSAGVLALAAAFGPRALDALGEDASAATTCVLTPEATEGPYWIDTKLTRRNITEGKAGLPLQLVLTVVNAKTCRPIKGADVEIWHCDADGEYSGYDGGSAGGGPGGGGPGGHQAPATSTRYLRGHQKSNAAGQAEFLTIFPGWYRGRTPHIHLKVHVGGRVVHTGQVFFNERITAAVYRQAPYSSHGQPDTAHASDNIFAEAGGSRAVVKLGKRAGSRRGYLGRIVLGVATA
jgi:protocatechuate 3,4-dioxygenase beta subunit